MPSGTSVVAGDTLSVSTSVSVDTNSLFVGEIQFDVIDTLVPEDVSNAMHKLIRTYSLMMYRVHGFYM